MTYKFNKLAQPASYELLKVTNFDEGHRDGAMLARSKNDPIKPPIVF